MNTLRRRRSARPLLPHEEIGRNAALPKPHPNDRLETALDTSELQLRKIHPERVPGFLRWLSFQLCIIFGLTDSITGQVHQCWHPLKRRDGYFRSDACHLEKAYSGRLKRDDRDSVPGCRFAHNLQEGATERFDRRFGINCAEKAAEYHVRYMAEKERAR